MMGSLGGWATDVWNILTGKPQSWYTNLSNLQNSLSLLLAGVTSIGGDMWDTVSSAAQGPTQDGTVASGVDPYASVTSSIQSAIQSIIVTQSYTPDDPTIAAAKATLATYQSQMAFVESILPEMAQAVQAGQAQVAAILPGPMTSPATVGQDTFTHEVANQAAALGSMALSGLTYALWAGGILAAFLLWKEMSKR